MLKRWLIRLRWPMAAAAILTLAAMAWSWWSTISIVGARAGVVIVRGSIQLGWGDAGLIELAPGWSLLQIKDWGWLGGTYRFGSSWNGNPTTWYDFVELPLWIPSLLLLELGALGFWAEGKRPTPGYCKRCRHTLKGAAICPECGKAAPSN